MKSPIPEPYKSIPGSTTHRIMAFVDHVSGGFDLSHSVTVRAATGVQILYPLYLTIQVVVVIPCRNEENTLLAN